MKKVISILLVLCLMLSSFCIVNAVSTTVTRGQLANMLVEASAYEDEAKGSTQFSVFTDVGKTTTYAQEIYIASRQGWMLGYTDGSFKPNNNVKLEEVCCAVLKYNGYNSKDLRGAFPDAYVDKAEVLGYLDNVNTKQGEYISLSDCKLIFKNAAIGDYKVSGSYIGIVQTVTKNIDSDDASTQGIYSVTCLDGETRTFTSDSYVSYKTGALVAVNVANSKATIRKLDSASVSGKVNTALTTLGDYQLADDLEILETDEYGNAMSVDKEVLKGITLSESDVRYYTKNASDEINGLILNDCTGSLYSYGICTSAVINEDMNFSASYKYIINGKTQSVTFTDKAFVIEEGGVAIKAYNNTVKKIRQLNSVKLDSVDEAKATGGYNNYNVASAVQVYVKDGNTYYLSSMDALLSSRYTSITGYVDTEGIKEVRIVVAAW